MFAHEFMRNAFLAGTFIAFACGLIGYFVVLRSQVFAGDALSHVAFTGALAAAAAGIDVRLGLFIATVAVAGGMGLLGERARADDVVIGSVFAWILGLGVLFLSLYTSGASGTNGTQGIRILFGSIFGLSVADARLAAVIAIAASLAVLVVARPLLFASVDPAVARSRGVPLRAIGIGFLILLGLVAAEATQAVGALLLLGLLAAPAGAARLLTDRPWRGLVLSAALAVGSMWIGLALSYRIGSVPPSSAVIGAATLVYALSALAALGRRLHIRRGDGRRPKMESVALALSEHGEDAG
jgi:zinc/manganese transport system permease protein